MIDDALFEEYASAIDANSDLLRAAVSSLESSLAGVSDRQLPQVMGALYASLVVEYGGYAAAIACEFYERQRAASGAKGTYAPTMEDGADQALLYYDAREAASSSVGLQSALGKLQGTAVQRAMEQADATIIGNASREGERLQAPELQVPPRGGLRHGEPRACRIRPRCDARGVLGRACGGR